jgi:hypothetical protein
MHMLFMFAVLAIAVGVNLVNGKLGLLGAREATWLLTMGLLAGVLLVAGFAVKARWDGIFIDRDNRISLSRFQLILWTVVLVSAVMSVGLANAMPPSAADPLGIEIPPQIWGLLGLGAFTAVAAPAIEDNKKKELSVLGQTSLDRTTGGLKARQGLDEEPMFVGRMLVKATARDARWIDLIMGDMEGSEHVDVSKLQQLAFTLVLVVVYSMALWSIIQGSTQPGGSPAISKFPEVGDGFLALLTISHAAYLADKQIAST